MKMIAQQSELDDTNKFSVRKTTITKLQKVGVPNSKIMGHKNEESIKHYAEMDLEDHKDIGRKISRVTLLEKQSVTSYFNCTRNKHYKLILTSASFQVL